MVCSRLVYARLIKPDFYFYFLYVQTSNIFYAMLRGALLCIITGINYRWRDQPWECFYQGRNMQHWLLNCQSEMLLSARRISFGFGGCHSVVCLCRNNLICFKLSLWDYSEHTHLFFLLSGEFNQHTLSNILLTLTSLSQAEGRLLLDAGWRSGCGWQPVHRKSWNNSTLPWLLPVAQNPPSPTHTQLCPL